MLTKEANEDLSRVGPGTPMGALMRRFWQPIAGSAEVSEREPTKAIRILGEDLVLYRDRSGKLGLIGPRCAHRNANLLYAVPECNGLRCCYHGWLYDETGLCIEQPSEPRPFRNPVKIPAYPVQELGGLVFAYLGPDSVPELPRWDVLAWENVSRRISVAILPCNWLQCMENSLDPVHFEWLHRYYGTYEIVRQNPVSELSDWHLSTGQRGKHHLKLGFERTDYGIIKRRMVEGETEMDDHWRLGHPILFPNVLRVGMYNWHGLHYRVPVDDVTTLHIMLDVDLPEPGAEAPKQNSVPVKHWPVIGEDGKIIQIFDGPFEPYHVVAQDQVAWIAQGPISDRKTENLGATDAGIVYYRKLLKEQLELVAKGSKPTIGRYSAPTDCFTLPCENVRYPGDAKGETGGPFKDYVAPKPTVEIPLG